MQPELETRFGRVRGERVDGVRVFRGIPFAAPVGGRARFAAPAAPEAWRGVRPALRFGPAPPQRSDAMIEMLGLMGDVPVGEDCLSLNVFTRDADGGRRPVLVWIHGGAFVNGTGGTPLYDGRHLARRGDAVVVTLNYRVGALGFLHVPGLGPDNRGLLDQLAALRWVAEHAESLGGDPGNVTVFGESAGAGSIACLLAMPEARRLVRRAIVQSAAPSGVIGRAEASRRAALFAAEVGLDPGAPERLADLALEELLDAQSRFALGGPYLFDMGFEPVVDGQVLPRSPLEAAARAETASIDLLIGTTSSEMQLFALAIDEAAFDEAALEKAVASELALTCEDGDTRTREVIDVYRRIRGTRGQSATPADLLYAIQSDVRLRHPSIRLASAHAGHGSRTYMYEFTWRSPFEGGRLGSCHAVDLPFTFGTLDAPGMSTFAGAGPAARALAASWMDAILSFARSGDPSCPATGDWPAYDTGSRATMAVGERCALRLAPGDEERAFLDGLEWRSAG